ncbi:hypothetical protein [Xylophilus sp.]|nr:hypothetical protein [Xylophilus sp.]KAF1044226.1 MAG: hypothetical protein GAK38_03655 [Xylophilus sp.]
MYPDRRTLLLGMAGGLLGAHPSRAATGPQRPIVFVVPYPAGGITDI